MENQIKYLFDQNPVLTISSGIFILLSLVIGFLSLFETSEVLGINLWIKPLKFSISIAIFLLTSIYLMVPLSYGSSKLNLLSWVLVITMFVEIGAIIFQAARGQTSHFNITDPIGSILFPLMGVAIVVAYSVYCVFLYDYAQNPPASFSLDLKWAVIIGITIFLFGAVSGFMMAGSLQHTVGVEDGGPGLPFLNWSTIAGDLRVSHFFSIHAIQVLPLTALLLSFLNLNEKARLISVVSIGSIWALLTLFTWIQAIAGKPFLKNIVS